MAVQSLINEGKITENPIKEQLGALSVGIKLDGKIIADLNYEEDSSCGTDMNIVMTSTGRFVEVQGTAEAEPFSKEQMLALLDCAEEALKVVFTAQNKVLNA